MPKEPSSDATWCIKQLFAYIELHVKNRVTAKIGRARSLEASKLSNLGSNAAMAHPSKALTPLSSARWRQSSIPINFTTQQRMRLREVFIHYCSWAEKHNYLYMSRTQFLKLCRDSCIMGPKLPAVALNLIFEKVHLDCVEPIPGVRLGLNDWLQALLRISAVMFREASPQEAFDALLEEHVLRAATAAGGSLGGRHEDRLAEVMLRQEVLEVLNGSRHHIRPIFNFYVNEQEFLDLGGSGGGWKEVMAARHRLPLNSFVRFGQDFELVPQLLTKTQLAEAFRCSRFGASGGPPADASEPEDMARIGFEEFVEALGRLALVAFNFQEPTSELRHIEFKESYEAAAKQLWVDSSAAAHEAEINFPDEVSMPAAAFMEHGLGNEDRPHTDDVLSRAASKVFGRARSTLAASRHQKVNQGPGLEVMHVHDEPPVLQSQRPLHLTQFSSDWVGRPGTPLTETAKLKKLNRSGGAKDQGWYSADQDLPPVFVDRAQRMIEARVIREQLSEGMRLGFKAEQRRCQMDSLTSSKTKRQHLQASSGQRLVGELPSQWGAGANEAPGHVQEPGEAFTSGLTRRFEQQADSGAGNFMHGGSGGGGGYAAAGPATFSACSSCSFQPAPLLQSCLPQSVEPAPGTGGRGTGKALPRPGRSATLLDEIQGLVAGITVGSKQ